MTSGSDSTRFKRWARLSHHYPGFTPDKIAVTPRAVLEAYEAEIPQLIAEEQSMLLDVIAFPHMEKSGQKSLIRRLERQLKTVEVEKPSSDDPRDLMRRGQAAGIGIQFVGPDGQPTEEVAG